jgi:hypothetical protein
MSKANRLKKLPKAGKNNPNRVTVGQNGSISGSFSLPFWRYRQSTPAQVTI